MVEQGYLHGDKRLSFECSRYFHGPFGLCINFTHRYASQWIVGYK